MASVHREPKLRFAISQILERAIAGRRISAAEGLLLLESRELASVGRAADVVARRTHPEADRASNNDRNINTTNICTSGCKFCAFSCSESDKQGYVLSRAELHEKIRETIELGGDQILLQGGMHPSLDIEWYEDLLTDIREHFPTLNVHGFGPPEIDHLASISRLPIGEVLVRLRRAGLGSLPGGGAEILVDRVRQEISPHKTSADRWIEVCRIWHELGGRGSATMMFGHVETLEERIEHLERIRRLQDETHAFTAFIGWTFQPGNTQLANISKAGTFDYLMMLAVSRLFLDNVPNIQASWVTQGLKVGQLALRFGANDMGSLMIEENVVAAAGTRFQTTESAMRNAITQMGFTPRRRNVFYELVD